MRGRVKFCPRCGGSVEKKRINGVKRTFCPVCDEIFYDNPLSSVSIIAEKDDKILFIKRGVEPAKGWWALPGGFIEQGESVEKAALRELREETGIRAKRAFIIKTTVEHTVIYGSIIVIGVVVSGLSGKLKANDDASDARWYDARRMPPLIFRSHRAFMREFQGPGNSKKQRLKTP